MSEPISSNVERLTREYVDGKRFTSSDDVLLFAMNLLGEFDLRFQRQVGVSLREAFEGMDTGDGLVMTWRA